MVGVPRSERDGEDTVILSTNVGIEREKSWLASKQNDIIIDVLEGYSADLSQALKELVGEKSAIILQRMQRSVISSTLNIARSLKFFLKRILAKVLYFRKKFH